MEAKAAWDLSGSSSGSLRLEANWLYEFPDSFAIDTAHFFTYLGGGAFFEVSGGGGTIGIRCPAGVGYRFPGLPIEMALEIGLGMRLFPATEIQGSGGLALRYRF